MKRTIVSLLLVTLFFGGLQAKSVDVNTAKSLGIKFMNVNTEIKSAQADLVYTAYTDNGQVCFYVFAMQPKGFVIVSADDRAKPILGYSTEGAFGDELPEGVESFFRNYRAGFSQMMAANESRTEEAVNDWNRLASTGKINDARITREVPHLLTTIWNQSALYNDLCPVDPLGSNNHVYAGCVATAMAQIINFWQWPQTGREMHSYDSFTYGELFVDFGNAHYHYELMPDFLDWTSRTEEIHAVAELLYHAGVSVDMGYSPEGSGAYSPMVPGALAYYFKYEISSMRYEQKDWYTNSEWENVLRENLDMGMPVYYSAFGNVGGHAFVCDGYDDNNMFHFNWGWQGLDNGYYAINAFYLSGGYSFPDSHDAILGICPEADYYLRPMPVGDLQVEAVSEGTNRITFTAPSMTICEFDLDQIDSILVFRNNEMIHKELNTAGGAQVTFDDTDALGIGHYTILPCAYEYVGDFRRDTILNGPTCEMTFLLHDSVGDGWLSKSISIIDSRGNAVTRLGLTEGSDATVKVEVPSEDELALHWAYSIGGMDAESYFEMYDWKGHQVYATSGKPFVGELCRFYSGCVEAVDEVEESVLKLYPNPVSAQLTIEGIDVEKVEVFNALGQCVAQYRQNVINFTNLESGVYFLHISSVEGQVFFEKVIKK